MTCIRLGWLRIVFKRSSVFSPLRYLCSFPGRGRGGGVDVSTNWKNLGGVLLGCFFYFSKEKWYFCLQCISALFSSFSYFFRQTISVLSRERQKIGKRIRNKGRKTPMFRTTFEHSPQGVYYTHSSTINRRKMQHGRTPPAPTVLGVDRSHRASFKSSLIAIKLHNVWPRVNINAHIIHSRRCLCPICIEKETQHTHPALS